MAVNGKQKGNIFERRVAEFLSLRFESHVGVPKGFTRRPDSGAYFGGKNRVRTETHLIERQGFGDIITPEKFFWSVETKHYKKPFSLNALLDQRCPELERWQQQALADATSAGKQALLIIKYNNVRSFVMVQEEELTDMDLRPVMPSEATFRFRGWLGYPMDVFFSNEDWCYFKVEFGGVNKLKFNKHEKSGHSNEPLHPICLTQPDNRTAASPKSFPEDRRVTE